MLITSATSHCRPARFATRAVRKTRGSTLIEVLVALLLMSFTLLGIAGLLSTTTRYQLGVEGRSKITLLYNDLTNRVRSNPSQTAGYLYNTDSWLTQQAAIPSRAKDCSGSAASTSAAAALLTCTAAERAADDLWVVRDSVRRAVPQGSVLISGDAANGLTTTFLWFDKDSLDPTTTNPGALKQSTQCSTSLTNIQLHSCCPTAAAVSSTPGVRCLNFTFIL